MAGEIHGLISREQAVRMWQPFGCRVVPELHGSLDPGNITPMEAVHVTLGSTVEDMAGVRELLGVPEGLKQQERMDYIRNACEYGVSADVSEILSRSNEQQQQMIEKLRQARLKDDGKYVRKLGKAVGRLAQEGLLTTEEAAALQDNLFDQEGNPFLQYVPMTQLEFARLYYRYDYEEMPARRSDLADFSLGIIASAVRFRPAAIAATMHNRPHETLHAGEGVELYDITRTDGIRWPVATVNGMFAFEPTTEIISDPDRSIIANEGVHEAWTEFVNLQVLRVDPSLGHSRKNTSYTHVASEMAEVVKLHPELFRHITRVMLLNAAPEEPDRKRGAIAEVREMADALIGIDDALDTIFDLSHH